jgi:hypothetical protein
MILPSVLLGIGTVNPFIGLAAAILPEILKAVVSDKAGTVAGAVTQAVADITQTNNPEEAAKKLNADPAAVAALQLKLAEIAAAQEEKRQQAQLAQLKEQNEAQLTLLKQQNETQLAQLKEQNAQEIKRREAQLAELRADMEDTKDARSSFAALALANNPMAWGAPVVSFIVTLGFFGTRNAVDKLAHGAAGHRIQLAIHEWAVIERRNVVALAHDLLHPSSADHPSLVRPHWLNTLAATCEAVYVF